MFFIFSHFFLFFSLGPFLSLLNDEELLVPFHKNLVESKGSLFKVVLGCKSSSSLLYQFSVDRLPELKCGLL